MWERKELKMKLRFKRLTDTAKIPAYAHDGDSGMDICADETVSIVPGNFKLIKTGVAAIIPCGYELQVRPRSGLQCKRGIVGGWGTVDEGYRGEIGVVLYNFSSDTYNVVKGERVAQLVLAPVCHADIEETNDLGCMTERGTNGFGSSGRY